MTDFAVRQSIEAMEEYAVESVAADVIVNANESNYPLPEEITAKVVARTARFPFNRYPPMKAENLCEVIAKELDVDIDCVNTKVQYNYSHDNEGGFILLCTDGSNGGYNKDISVRYNISQNDKSQIFTLSGPISDVKIYNNTVYTKAGLRTNLVGSYDWGTAASPKNVRFTNNIFNMISTGWCSFIIPSRITFDTNLFYGTYGFTQLFHSGVKISGTLTADPMFVNPGTGVIGRDTLGGYRLKSGSPAINSGKWISQCGGRDFFGKSVTKEGLPDLGAIEY